MSEEKKGPFSHARCFKPEDKVCWRSGGSTWKSEVRLQKAFLPLTFQTTLRHFSFGLGKGCTNHTGGAGSSLIGAQALPAASFGCLKPLALIVALPCLNKQCWDYSHCGKWDGLCPSSPERGSQSWLCWARSWQPKPLTS